MSHSGQWHIGGLYGIRIGQMIGPWVSLGIHTHFAGSQSHIDLHIIWWLIVIGRTYHD